MSLHPWPKKCPHFILSLIITLAQRKQSSNYIKGDLPLSFDQLVVKCEGRFGNRFKDKRETMTPNRWKV